MSADLTTTETGTFSRQRAQPKRALPAIADEIGRELQAAERSWRDAVGHAIRAGELLTEAKTLVKHGEWGKWLDANFPSSRTTATNYMRLARESATVADLPTVREAVALLAQPKPEQEDQLTQAAEVSTDVDGPANARELVPLLGDEAALIEVWREANESGHEITAKMLGTFVRSRVAQTKREREAERRRKEGVEPVSTHGEIEIRHGDLREVLDDLNGRVDAIITDPPYPHEFIEEFDALGDLAARVLTPDGLLLAMVGQAHLLRYGDLLGRHLEYRWCGAYLTEGPATRIQGRGVATNWKPLLLFDRRGKRRWLQGDAFSSPGRKNGADKAYHHWGQSELGFREIVEKLTEPGDLVVDPFLGGGTTAVVCRDLGRRFIGCDIDAAAVATARRRLAGDG